MTRDFNTVVAHFGADPVPGRIEALEGGRGMMRVSLDLNGEAPPLSEGSECVLEMHDGARFRFTVTERLPGGGNELRMKLLGKA
ncbi:hypothetical protein [Deinococcus planocerae]|uniref:hypothetical protein n=1 Tax=Deinococcus planocerae TaxID=1737569 RepID=UPI000C7EF738|nr:hypothetical protein [Deinococcus planocerae]